MSTITVKETLQSCVGGGAVRQAPKTETSARTVQLPQFATLALREHRRDQATAKLASGAEYQDEGLVCCRQDGRHWVPSTFSAAFAKAMKSVGHEGFRFHDLRHTHASQLINAGVDVQTISGRLGHSTPTTTLRVYSHQLKGADAAAAASIEKALGTRLKKAYGV